GVLAVAVIVLFVLVYPIISSTEKLN
ncbi:MAG: hypothetical protein RLZZ209_1401, partial [Bacteroidota bacterium]